MGRTHEALRRAEANFQKRNFQKKQAQQRKQTNSIERLENRLKNLKLGEDQILDKNLKEIGQSLNQLDSYITNPKSVLNMQFKDIVVDIKKDILPVLIERKELTLNRFNELVSMKKYNNIKRLLKEIADDGIRTAIGKIINELQIKDKILKKEYQKLERLRLTIYNDQQQNFKGFSEEIHQKQQIDQKKEKPRESNRVRDSLGILIMGILLICLTFFTALAPFYNIPVPNILNSAFLILLGFFMGLTIAKLARS